MKLLGPFTPSRGERGYTFVKWFINHVNWCHGYYYGTATPKPVNKIYDFFYKYWLFPFEQTECICCNTVRGLIYGFILGAIVGSLI